jgi:anti-sigma factor RsiW
MNHDLFREHLALRIYGELSPEEERGLEAHLASCAECRALRQGLERTLAGLAALERSAPAELDARWSERQLAATEARPVRPQPLAWFAVGLAAGLLAMALLRAPRDGAPAEPALVVHSNAGRGVEFVARPDPPPPTTSRGILAHAGTWRRD